MFNNLTFKLWEKKKVFSLALHSITTDETDEWTDKSGKKRGGIQSNVFKSDKGNIINNITQFLRFTYLDDADFNKNASVHLSAAHIEETRAVMAAMIEDFPNAFITTFDPMEKKEVISVNPDYADGREVVVGDKYISFLYHVDDRENKQIPMYNIALSTAEYGSGLTEKEFAQVTTIVNQVDLINQAQQVACLKACETYMAEVGRSLYNQNQKLLGQVNALTQQVQALMAMFSNMNPMMGMMNMGMMNMGMQQAQQVPEDNAFAAPPVISKKTPAAKKHNTNQTSKPKNNSFKKPTNHNDDPYAGRPLPEEPPHYQDEQSFQEDLNNFVPKNPKGANNQRANTPKVPTPNSKHQGLAPRDEVPYEVKSNARATVEISAFNNIEQFDDSQYADVDDDLMFGMDDMDLDTDDVDLTTED